MTAWVIFLLVLGPSLVFTGWVLIRQLRGGFDGPEPERTEPDFLRRHAWLGAWVVVGIVSLKIGGLSGLLPGLFAGAVLFVVLTIVGSLLATMIEPPAHQGPGDEGGALEFGGTSPTSTAPRDRFHRRFVRNLKRAAQEGPRFRG